MRVVWILAVRPEGCAPAGCRHVRTSQVLDGDPPGIIPSCRESPCSPSDVYLTSTSCGSLTGPGRLSTEVAWKLRLVPVNPNLACAAGSPGDAGAQGKSRYQWTGSRSGTPAAWCLVPSNRGFLAAHVARPSRTRSKRHGQATTFALEDLGAISR